MADSGWMEQAGTWSFAAAVGDLTAARDEESVKICQKVRSDFVGNPFSEYF